MSTLMLYPPISRIERRLFAVPDDVLAALAENAPGIAPAIRDAAFADPETRERIERLRQSLTEDAPLTAEIDETLEPPAFIKALISQKVAAGRADFGAFPGSGQMLKLDRLPTPSGAPADLLIASPLTVLLNVQDKDSKVWHGWMMASEVQYAGFWDLLLEPEDEPFDPLCGMVQIWNPVQLYFPADFKADVIGRLSPARLLAVQALAYEYLQGDPILPRSRPGFIALRATENGYGIVTGSPLGGNDDPRRAYQHCYHHVAELLNAPVSAWQAESAVTSAGLLESLRDAVAAAWRELTGIVAQPLPPVAHAMHVADEIAQVGLTLHDDLYLYLTQTDTGIDLSMSYHGPDRITVSITDGGEKACSVTLDSRRPTLDYSGLDHLADNRLHIGLPDGKQIDLPISMINAW